MRNLTICIDMDDTIEYLLKAWTKWLEDNYHYGVKAQDIDSWDIAKFYPGLSWDQICEPLQVPEFWDTVKPMEDAIEIIPKLKEDGHQVYICTSTHYSIAPFKFDRCLFKHFPFIKHNDVILTFNKQLIKCDVLIDDGAHNIIGDYIGLLMDSPSNRHFNTNECQKVFRVFNWYDIYDKIKTIENAD